MTNRNEVINFREEPHVTRSDLGLSDANELDRMHQFWQACCYLAAGMIYLQDNPLLREPLKAENIKQRLLGHWGTSPGLSFVYTHLNRVIQKFDLNMIFLAGPGHGAPGVLAPVYLERTYSEVYDHIGRNTLGLKKFMKQFSFPGGVGSHCTPETPGSIHEGGELGYSLSHAFGAVFDNPDLIATVVIGDGESETGPLAAAWHSNKFLNPVHDGAVLPILHLNGYKINNPTVLSRIDHDELEAYFKGLGYVPYFVEGCDPHILHQLMAQTLDQCIEAIQDIQLTARTVGTTNRPKWPVIILRTPKGWTGPKVVDGHKIEGTWRSHQVPLNQVRENKQHLEQLEQWLLSYEPNKLFDTDGALRKDLEALCPLGSRRMSANPHTNGDYYKPLALPDYRQYSVAVQQKGLTKAENTRPLGRFLRDIIFANPHSFRIFGPDETASNKLDAVFEASQKCWVSNFHYEDVDGTNIAFDGRTMEILSEHTLEGWLEGYLLTGRHGLLSTYEAFAHVIDSMINQHAKWLETSRQVNWRKPIASLNLLITSTVWRQDHNGFTHQDPGFLDLIVNKSPDIVRVYLPPDANTLLSCADHCLRSQNYINVIVSDKQEHLQYLSIDDAAIHCQNGIGVWSFASNEKDGNADIIIACAGDSATHEALAAVDILRANVPALKIRFVNIVDLLRLVPPSEHPHGLSDLEFENIFGTDIPIVFNFHGYPWLVHRLTYRRKQSNRLHVRGYKEQGNINTPLELAIKNQTDRFSLVLDVLKQLDDLEVDNEVHSNVLLMQKRCVEYAREWGVDHPLYANWVWRH